MSDRARSFIRGSLLALGALVGGPVLAAGALAGVPGAGGVAAQEGSSAADSLEGWNSPRVMEMVGRARERRQEVVVDSAFRSYRADARGNVYFFLDRREDEERTLVKADQIALEVFWRAPNDTRQRIVGLRDEKVLPTTIKYHLDHLTVVQDDFDDRIRMGDGDEVADVIHPVAPGSQNIYDFRLSDSLTLSFPGRADTVRVYEVQVRPQDFDLPGFVGTILLDREGGAIVRMSFTFTPVSYVDPYLDYIRISLDNSLWMGRYWLPYRQEAELRRELPQLDFLAGSVIRGRFEIGNYRFNEDLSDALFMTRRVTSLPEEQREAFPFEEPLFADLEEEGLSTPPSLDEVRAQAREMAADRYLSGLGRLRLHASSSSDVYRFGRAEGHVLGGGAAWGVTEDRVIRAHAGWSFGRDEPLGSLRLTPRESGGWSVEAYGNRPVDVGPFPAAAGAVNSLAGLVADEDYTDPYFAHGVRGWTTTTLVPSWWTLFADRARLGLRYERHESAAAVVDDAGEYRPVRPVREGDLLGIEMSYAWGVGPETGDGWGAALSADGAYPLPKTDLRDDYFRLVASAAWARTGAWRELDLSGRLDAGLAGSAPQSLFLLGGRGTLLGHPFRHFVGDRLWLGRVDAERTVLDPWISLRAFGAAGQARLDDPLPDGWPGDPDAGAKASLGLGVGLLWDVVRIDVGRGLGEGGGWATAFAVARRFHGWL